jgi:4-hydroxyphenylpyruvate dioxygenase-like putative hemolysin
MTPRTSTAARRRWLRAAGLAARKSALGDRVEELRLRLETAVAGSAAAAARTAEANASHAAIETLADGLIEFVDGDGEAQVRPSQDAEKVVG